MARMLLLSRKHFSSLETIKIHQRSKATFCLSFGSVFGSDRNIKKHEIIGAAFPSLDSLLRFFVPFSGFVKQWNPFVTVYLFPNDTPHWIHSSRIWGTWVCLCVCECICKSAWRMTQVLSRNLFNELFSFCKTFSSSITVCDIIYVWHRVHAQHTGYHFMFLLI